MLSVLKKVQKYWQNSKCTL